MTDDSDRRGVASTDDEGKRAREGAGAAPQKGPAHEFPPERGREADRMGGETAREGGSERVEAVTHDREGLAADTGSPGDEPRGEQSS